MKKTKRIIVSVLLILMVLASTVVPGISAYFSDTESHTSTVSLSDSVFNNNEETT